MCARSPSCLGGKAFMPVAETRVPSAPYPRPPFFFFLPRLLLTAGCNRGRGVADRNTQPAGRTNYGRHGASSQTGYKIHGGVRRR